MGESENLAANSEQSARQKRIENLRPFQFQPGQSGNPTGRPKRTLLSDMTAELLEEIAADPEKREQFKQSIQQKLLAKGVVSAMTLDKLWERHEGKVTQPVQIDGDLNLTLSERFAKAKQSKDEALHGGE